MKFATLTAVRVSLFIEATISIAAVQQLSIAQQSHLRPDRKINISKCCNQFMDGCENSSLPAPVIYSAQDKETIVKDRFSLNWNLNYTTECPDGFVTQSLTDFRFYDDGSLSTAAGSFDSGAFCLDQKNEDDPEIVARFCVDPCNETNCIRKCCPDGMAMNISSKFCQLQSTDDGQMAPIFMDEYGTVSDVFKLSSFKIVDDLLPSCRSGYFLTFLDPSEREDEQFYILPSGEVYVPGCNSLATQTKTNDYCIDLFFNEGSPVLICLRQGDEKDQQLFASHLYASMLLFSSVFLAATFAVYALLPEIRNIHGVTVMCYVAALTVTYIGFGVINLGKFPEIICRILAVINHFFFLSAFTWLNVMSFDIWLTFGGMQSQRSSLRRRNSLGRRFLFYSFYAWGVPFIIVLVGQVFDELRCQLPLYIIKPNFGMGPCWFADINGILVYLYAPISFVVLSNVVFFFLTAVRLYKASVEASFATNNSNHRQKFRVIFSLFVLMGVSWAMEVVSFVIGGSIYIWIPTDILNILTGIFVFVIFVCKKKVWILLKQKYPFLKSLERGSIESQCRTDGSCATHETISSTI